MEGIFSQWIHILNHHIVYFNHLTILFVDCTSIKLKMYTYNTLIKIQVVQKYFYK